jgi:hypothetical protein
MTKIGRNDPCSCGSGIKFKKCCLNKHSSPTPAISIPLTLNERTTILYNAMVDIFGVKNAKEWNDIKKFVTGDRISHFHKIIASLWPPDTNLEPLLPKSDDGKLRAFYMGRHRPDLIIKNIVRYSLYTDEILILLPFQNPWSIRSEFNPILNPDQYKSYMLQNIDFTLRLAPWIFSGHVKFIPDPGDFDYELRKKTFELAENQKENFNFSLEDIPDEIEYVKEHFFKPFIMCAPEDYLRRTLKKWKPEITPEETNEMIAAMRKTVENDPYMINEPRVERKGQLLVSKCGTSIGMGLYISNLTGAYMFTDWKPKWDLIHSACSANKMDNLWTPLTNAFQKLDFKFLNNVNPEFACSLRKDGRLEIFRSFLRKTWNEINKDQSSLSSSIGINYADELKARYSQAQAEWDDIDKNIIQKTAMGTAFTSVGGALASGGMNWEIPAGGFILSAITNILTAKYDRNRFKVSCPMSVFIDLKEQMVKKG